MLGKVVLFGATLAVVAVLSVVGIASAAPDNKNSQTIGLTCDHGVGSILTSTIQQNSAIVLTLVTPKAGAFVIHRVFIDGQLVVEAPGFAGRDLVRCTPTTVNGQPIPPEDPDVVFEGILTGK